MLNKIIVIGSSGHARVIIELLEQINYEIIGCIDSFAPKGKKVLNYEVLGDEFYLKETSNLDTLNICIAIGNNYHRREMFERLYNINPLLQFPNIISQDAIVSPSLNVGVGNVIMDRAILHSSAVLGDFNVVNTASIVEHDCKLGNFTSVSPNATLCGNVVIENMSFVGAGSTIIQNIVVEKETVIGAGAVVIAKCDQNSLYVGNPAKKVQENYSKINYL
jgi:sugar O-acyltransferase (sialic acid O-acetyltransferase NeuD family)